MPAKIAAIKENQMQWIIHMNALAWAAVGCYLLWYGETHSQNSDFCLECHPEHFKPLSVAELIGMFWSRSCGTQGSRTCGSFWWLIFVSVSSSFWWVDFLSPPPHAGNKQIVMCERIWSLKNNCKAPFNIACEFSLYPQVLICAFNLDTCGISYFQRTCKSWGSKERGWKGKWVVFWDVLTCWASSEHGRRNSSKN